jgi:hypothetical protein
MPFRRETAADHRSYDRNASLGPPAPVDSYSGVRYMRISYKCIAKLLPESESDGCVAGPESAEDDA